MKAVVMPADNALVQFLDMLLKDKPDDVYVLIWVLDPKDEKYKRSFWLQSTGQIIKTVSDARDKQQTVYIGCGWTLKDYGPYQRAKAAQINGMPALWSDVDILHAVHKRDNLPPTVKDVIIALKDITPEPSIIVNSGYGLHIWWLFEQPWMFENDEERKLAAQLSIAWHKYIQAKFKERGWGVDTTSDLSRVLRLPDTYNYKLVDDPKLVEIAHTTNSRYTPDALREWLNKHDRGIVTSIIPKENLVGGGDFVLRGDAQPPADKWTELLLIDVSVGDIWEHRKKTGDDRTQSGWDSSLACLGARQNWTDQEIVDLVIANRRKFDCDLMLENRQYYERLLAQAREHASKFGYSFFEDEKEIREKIDVAQPLTETEQDKTVAILNRWMEIGDVKDKEGNTKPALVSVVCYTTTPATYYIELYNREGEKRKFKVGDGNDIRDQKKWSRVIWDERGHDTKIVKKAEWQEAIRLIAAAMKRESPGDEGTEGGLLRAWIRDHVGPDVPTVTTQDDKYARLKSLSPYIENGEVYFSMPELAQWLRTHRGTNIEESRLMVMLRSIGGEPKAVNYSEKDDFGETRRQKRRLWKVPWNYNTEDYAEDNTIKTTEDREKLEIADTTPENTYEEI